MHAFDAKSGPIYGNPRAHRIVMGRLPPTAAAWLNLLVK
jgi:hypothetical protein